VVKLAVSNRSAWRRVWISFPAAVLLLALALPVTARAETFLGSLNVPLDGSKVYSAPLVAGGVYRIDASGSYTQTVGIDLDAVYCYFSDSPVPGACSPPGHSHVVVARYEGDTSLTADLDALNPATTLAYSPLHTYQETFTAPSSSRLEVFYKYSPTFFFSGAIRLDLYLVSLPAAPGAGGGGGSGGGVRRLLEPATAWGNPGPETAMAPGDGVTVASPAIGPRQREADVTIRGAPAKEIAVSARTRAHQCVNAFIDAIRNETYTLDIEPVTGKITYKSLNENSGFFLSLLEFLACMEELREADARHSAKQSMAAASSGCRLRSSRVDLDLDRASKSARFKVRPSRRGPARRKSHLVKISCRAARDGAVTLRIRSRSRRAKLRKLVGRRLVIGVYRAREASGTAKVRATFHRP